MSLAFYSHSMLLLSELGQEGRSKLLVTARDMTIPPVGISGGVHSLREAVGELEMAVPGKTCGHHLLNLKILDAFYFWY